MTEPSPRKGERIAKALARAGVASRRGVERLIGDGRVKVNGKTLETPAFLVDGSERIEVDGKVVSAAEETKLWLYHKPAGLVVSHQDPEGRPTVFEALPKDMGRVISVGRLDLASEGLLLLTNNGELARHLERPDTGWVRHYRVRVHGAINEKKLEQVRKGVTIEGVRYAPAKVELEGGGRTNRWLDIAIREGKNREIRKLMTFAGVQVNRLLRTSFGPFQLGSLKRGEVKHVTKPVLRQQLGKRAGEFGL